MNIHDNSYLKLRGAADESQSSYSLWWNGDQAERGN